jgi:hypothetical protein
MRQITEYRNDCDGTSARCVFCIFFPARPSAQVCSELARRPGDFELHHNQSRASMCRNGMVGVGVRSHHFILPGVSMRSIGLLGKRCIVQSNTLTCDTRMIGVSTGYRESCRSEISLLYGDSYFIPYMDSLLYEAMSHQYSHSRPRRIKKSDRTPSYWR